MTNVIIINPFNNFFAIKVRDPSDVNEVIPNLCNTYSIFIENRRKKKICENSPDTWSKAMRGFEVPKIRRL